MTRLEEIQSIYLGNNNPHPTELNLYFQTSLEPGVRHKCFRQAAVLTKVNIVKIVKINNFQTEKQQILISTKLELYFQYFPEISPHPPTY